MQALTKRARSPMRLGCILYYRSPNLRAANQRLVLGHTERIHNLQHFLIYSFDSEKCFILENDCILSTKSVCDSLLIHVKRLALVTCLPFICYLGQKKNIKLQTLKLAKVTKTNAKSVSIANKETEEEPLSLKKKKSASF